MTAQVSARDLLIQKDISDLSPEDVQLQFTSQVDRLQRSQPNISVTERTGINDEISIWMVKIIKYQKQNGELDILSSLEFIFQTVVDYLGSSAADTVSMANALNSSLTNLLIKLLTYVSLLENGGSAILRQWLEDKVVYKLSRTSKNLYYFVEMFLKHGMDPNWLIEGDSQFLESTIRLLNSKDNNPLANSMSRAVVALFKKKINLKNDNDIRFWINSWITYMPLDLQNDSNIAKYLIPQFFKVTERVYPVFIQLVTENMLYNSRVLLGFRCVGQSLRLETVVPTELLWSSSMKQWLTDFDCEVRLLAFKYITGSTKVSAPIDPQIYWLIKDTLIIQSFMNEFENLEIRNLLCSALDLFLKRIKAKDIEGMEFVTWLLDYLIPHYLLPSSTYPQLSTAMKILSAIFRTISYSNVNDDIARLLYLNLSNNYENIRQQAYQLLVQFSSDGLEVGGVTEKIVQLVNDDDDDIHTRLGDVRGRRSEAYANVYAFASEFIHKEDPVHFQTLFNKIIDPLKDIKGSMHRIHGHLSYLRMMIPLHYEVVDVFLANNIVDINASLWECFRSSLELVDNNTTNNDDDDDDDITTISHWKAIKEANELLLQFTVHNRHLLSYDQLQRAMNMIVDQLENIKHRGVFLSVYPSFITITSMCFNHTDSTLDALSFLNTRLNQIITKSQAKSRRSAGLPYIMSGLLAALEDSSELSNQCFDRLFEIARTQFEYDAKNDLPQVHAFNILKQLYSESLISSHLLDVHLPQTLDLCLEFFTSSNWSIRNCSVMLFGVLQRHLFPSSGKKLSSVTIFNRYPNIKLILLNHLKAGKAFPVVSILTNIVNSSNDDSLEPLQQCLLQTLSHPHWKIRKMTARALASILSTNQLNDFLTKRYEFDSDNQFHGTLLGIHEVVLRIKTELYGHEIPEKVILALTQLFIGQLQPPTPILLSHWVILETLVNTLDLLEQWTTSTISPLEEAIIGELVESDTTLNGSREAYLLTLTKVLLQHYLKQNQWNKIEHLTVLTKSHSRAFEVALEFNSVHYETIPYTQEFINQLTTPTPSQYIQCQVMDFLGLMAAKKACTFELTDDIHHHESSNELKCRQLYVQSIVSPLTPPDIDTLEQYLLPDSPEPLRILAAKTVAQLTLSSSSPCSSRGITILFELLSDEEMEIRQVACQTFQSICHLPFVPNPIYLMRILLEYDTIEWDWNHLLSQQKINHWIEQVRNSFELNTIFDFEPSNIYRNELDTLAMISKLKQYKPSHCPPLMATTLEEHQHLINEPAVFVLFAMYRLVSGQSWHKTDSISCFLATGINQAFA